MAKFRAAKAVSALPGTLTPDTAYFVRTGAGFDLYCSDSTGSIAHKVNTGGSAAELVYPNFVDKPPAVPNAFDDEFDGPVVNPIWTPVNMSSGGAVCSVTQHDSSLFMQDNVSISGYGRLLCKPAPTGDFEIVAKGTLHGHAQYNNIGVGVCDAGGMNFAGVRGVARVNYSPQLTCGWLTFVDPVGLTGQAEGANIVPYRSTVYMKISRVGTTTTFWVSDNGVVWLALLALPGRAYTQIALFYSNFSTATFQVPVAVAQFEWIRRTA